MSENMTTSKLSFTHMNVHVGKTPSGTWLSWVELTDDYRLVTMSPPSEGKPLTNVMYPSKDEGIKHAYELCVLMYEALKGGLPVTTYTVVAPGSTEFYGLACVDEKAWFLVDKKTPAGEHQNCTFADGDVFKSALQSLFDKVVFIDPKVIVHLIQDEPFIPSKSAPQKACSSKGCGNSCGAGCREI